MIPLTAEQNRLATRLITLALFVGVCVLLVPYIPGLLGGPVLYVLARPVLSHLERRRARRVAAFVTVLGLFGLLVLPGVWILLEAIAELPNALRTFEASPAVQRLMSLTIGSLDVGAQVQRATTELLRWGSAQTVGMLGSVLSATVNLVIALFGTYYLLMSGEALWERTRVLLPFCPTTSELLRVRFHRVTEAMLLGVVVAAAAQGILVGLAFVVLGLPHALLWGSVTAAASILPMFGSALVWVPTAGILLLQARPGAAIALVVFGALVVSNVDNALRLFVYRRVSHIHPMVTLVGAFAGVNAFGLAGLVLGPLVLSYAIEMIRLQTAGDAGAGEPRTAGQGFPLSTTSVSPTPAGALSA